MLLKTGPLGVGNFHVCEVNMKKLEVKKEKKKHVQNTKHELLHFQVEGFLFLSKVSASRLAGLP